MNAFIRLLQSVFFRPKQPDRPLTPTVVPPPQRHAGLMPRLDHPKLGTLTYDVNRGAYVAASLWRSEQIELAIQVNAPEEMEDAIRSTLLLLEEQAIWAPRIDEYSVSELLQRKNDVWREDDEAPLSADEFVARMKLESIDMDASGNFCFWHDDGDLFWGHCIEISGNLREGPTGAAIPG